MIRVSFIVIMSLYYIIINYWMNLTYLKVTASYKAWLYNVFLFDYSLSMCDISVHGYKQNKGLACHLF